MTRKGFRIADPVRHSRQPGRRRQPVTVETVDPRVLETAKALAGGDCSRLQLVDPTTVLVLNNPVSRARLPLGRKSASTTKHNHHERGSR